MQPVLDLPGAADVPGQLPRACLLGVEAGDAVGDLFAGALPVQATGVAADAEHLGGMGEVDAVVGDGLDSTGALFGASVPAVDADVFGCEVAGRAGQRR